MPSVRPWMTAIEMQFAALRWAAEVSAILSTSEARGFYATVHTLLTQAECFSWLESPAHACLHASHSVPSTSTLVEEAVPFIPQWWWFGDGVLPFIMTGIDGRNIVGKKPKAVPVIVQEVETKR